MNEEERIANTERIVKENSLDAEVIRHPDFNVIDVDSHIRFYGSIPQQIMKGLIFTSKGKFVAVIASGEVKIDMKKLEHIADMKKPRMATQEELQQIGLEKGAVGPFTIPDDIPIFIEQKLLEKDEIVGSAGSPRAGLRIKPGQILKVINAKVVDLAKDD